MNAPIPPLPPPNFFCPQNGVQYFEQEECEKVRIPKPYSNAVEVEIDPSALREFNPDVQVELNVSCEFNPAIEKTFIKRKLGDIAKNVTIYNPDATPMATESFVIPRTYRYLDSVSLGVTLYVNSKKMATADNLLKLDIKDAKKDPQTWSFDLPFVDVLRNTLKLTACCILPIELFFSQGASISEKTKKLAEIYFLNSPKENGSAVVLKAETMRTRGSSPNERINRSFDVTLGDQKNDSIPKSFVLKVPENYNSYTQIFLFLNDTNGSTSDRVVISAEKTNQTNSYVVNLEELTFKEEKRNDIQPVQNDDDSDNDVFYDCDDSDNDVFYDCLEN